MRTSLAALFVVLYALTVSPSAFARQRAATPLDLGRRALSDRRYDDAARELAAAVALGGEKAHEAQLLLGHAYFHGKKYAEAIAAYDRLLREFPNSPWRKKALFRKADCHLELKQYDKAAAIYEPELAFLVSDQRKEQVADTYLKFADQYFAPPKNPKGETPAPNFPKAKSLFEKAAEIGLTVKKREEVLFKIALCDANAGSYNTAIPALEALVDEFPKGGRLAEARYQIGLCQLKAGNDRAARRVFRDFLADFPKSELRGDASYGIAQSYHVPQPRDDRELELGVQALRAFVAEFPKHPKALEGDFFVGLSYFNQQRYSDANRELLAFLERRQKEAADELAQAKHNAGMALLRQKKDGEAIATWEQFLREFPFHHLWNTVQRQLIDAHYAVGDEAYRAKKHDEARRAWQAFQERYPLDFRNGDIMFRLGMMLYDEKQFAPAIEQWQKVASKYRDSEAASRAQFMIAKTHEEGDRFEEAMAAYKEVKGTWQAEAQRRLNGLRGRNLMVYTERTFTTGDPAALKLVTRNVRRVEFRAYRVEMGDYFGKLQSIRGVEKLDLALIEPDQRWELDLPNYRDFKQNETEAHLPFRDPGVYAVACQAPLDTEDQQPYRDAGKEPPVLETTSVVLITDLGIITRATHRDLVVFAQNTKTGQPWPNAAVVVSDGERMVARGKTGADGVYRHEGPGAGAPGALQGSGSGQGSGLAQAEDGARPQARLVDELRVLASVQGHHASTEGDLGKVAAVAERQPTAFLYTDRPVYRPGQPVRLRGIVRQVEKGLHVFKKGDEYALAVLSAQGTAVHTRKVRLGDFGTFNDEFTLQPEAPLGEYRLLLTQRRTGPDQPDTAPAFAAEGSFRVATYRLEKVRLAIELPKAVYLRGEEIKGKIVARYYYGEPVARRRLQFGWLASRDDSGSAGEEFETDDKGEVAITVPTRPFEEEATVTLWARLEEEGAQTALQAHVAVVGVNAELAVLRDLHLAGEQFDVQVAAKDLAGKPFGGAFTLQALKLEKEDSGRIGEREVQSLRVATDATEGKGKVALALKEAGEYTLRLRGKDANGNPLTAELATQVVGEEDEVRLRVLTESDSFRLGETAVARVLWRGSKTRPLAAGDAGERLALVTYEGERVHGYQLVRLKRGENAVRVPLTGPLVPVFQLSVSLMDGSEFHTAAKWLRVEQQLQVKVRTEPAKPGAVAQASFRPRDRVRVVVETTDQNGKPVAAELSLAAIDAALLAVAGGQLPNPREQFQVRAPVEEAVLAASSCTFHYAAEAKQRVLLVREAESMVNVMLAGVGSGEEIGPGHWAYDQLQRLGQAGLIQGWANGRYRGRAALNRLDVADALNQALDRYGLTPQDAENYAFRGQRAQSRAGAPAQSAGGGSAGARGGQADQPADGTREALGRLANEFQSELLQQLRLHDGQEQARPPQSSPAPQARAEGAPPPPGRAGGFGPGSGGAGEARRELGRGRALGGERGGSGGGLAAAPGTAELEEDVEDERALGELAERALRSRFLETAFWNGQVVTDAQGKAAVEFELPDSLTEWRVAALGVTTDTLTGTAEGSLVTSKLILVELKTPAVLQQGDRAVLTAVARNNGDAPLKATLSLRAEFQDAAMPRLEPQTVEIPAHGTREVPFALDVPNSRGATLTLQATTEQAGGGDSVQERLAVRPWGIEHVATAGGTGQGERTAELKLPEGKYHAHRLAITVGPNVQAALVEIAANPGGYGWGQPLTDVVAQRAACLVHAVGYLRSLNAGAAAGPHAETLRRLTTELEGVVARLVATQQGDGSWRWALPPANGWANQAQAQQAGDLRVTTDVVTALAGARSLGIPVPAAAMAKALANLQARFQRTGEGDNGAKARILAAQSAANAADFAAVNRLHRLRSALDTRSLALLSLALVRMERGAMALDCTRLLAERLPKDELNRYLQTGSGPTTLPGYPGPDPGTSIDLVSLEDVALVAYAMAMADPKHPAMEQLTEFLWVRRSGLSWATPRDTSLALAALIRHARATQLEPERYTLAVTVNGKEVRKIDVAGNAATTTFEVPAELVTGPAAKVGFQLQGRGTYTYSCVLRGFTDEGLLADPPAERPAPTIERPLRVVRTFSPAPRLWEGKPVPQGFATVTNAVAWRNLATEVAAGRHVQVQLQWSAAQGVPVGSYVVLREPLPSGCRALENSIQGSFERYELGEGEITFFFSGRNAGAVTYDLYGALEGGYRALPARVWSVERPGIYAYGTIKPLAVVGRDAQPKDEYRLTPDELFFLGKAHFERVEDAVAQEQAPTEADLKAAQAHLVELFDRDADPKGWKLRDDPARETTRMLFTLALHRKDAPQTVRFFEVLRERHPGVVIPFKEIVRTALAYRQMGEREREAQVYRATAESSFGVEARVAGVLANEGEYQASFDFLAALAREYPDLANVESGLYALAQTVSQRAEQGRQQGARGLYRGLTQQAAEILRDFLAQYPEHPVGDEASFALAVNLVEQERFEEAAEWCARSAALYPKSEYCDDFAYVGAYASFLGEKFDDALKMAAALAVGQFPLGEGGTGPSPYRLFALYIAAQIHHARSQPGEAVKYYAQVAEQFPDAREAAEYFRARALRVPEVVAAGPDEPLRLKVSARNVGEAQVSVYRVDLLKFYQNRRSLADLGQMNLAGIKPTWEGTLNLGPQQFVDKEKSLELPLKEKGAYFVTVKANDSETRLQASGILVRTDLALEVQEDPGNGRVRVHVVNRTSGALQPKAEVWVVGTDNDAFRKGTTDLRGIVYADDVRGRPAVIAAKGGDYAIYRGEQVLQPQLARSTPPPAVATRKAPGQPDGKLAFKEQAKNLFAERQRANERTQDDYLKNRLMGGFGQRPTANAPGQGGLGGFGGGGLGGVSAGSVR